MIKTVAYFDSEEYSTKLPLTIEAGVIIEDNMYGYDYVEITPEFGISEEHRILVQDFINECYDLVEANEIAIEMLDWGREEFETYLAMIEGKEYRSIGWDDNKYNFFVGRYI